MIGIYKIENPEGEVYVGQSRNIEKRFKQHGYKAQQKLYTGLKKSYEKHGFENHKFEVIEECSISKLNERERYWQEYYDVLNHGLNNALVPTKNKKGKYKKESILKRIKTITGRKLSEEHKRNIGKGVSRSIKLICSICGNEFHRMPSRIIEGKNNSCSKKCASKLREKNKLLNDL